MSRPTFRPGLELCGVVKLAKARGPGWTVGEPYARQRDSGLGVELVRPAYYGNALDAVHAALRRAQDLAGPLGRGDGPESAVGATAGLTAAVAQAVLDCMPEVVAWARGERGWSRAELAERAGVHRGTVWALEERGRYSLPTLLRVLGALT